MKRKLIFTSLFLILGLVWVAGSAIADRVSRTAELTSVTGAVEWLKAGDVDWQAAALNQKFESGDKIRTGEDGSATLALDDGSTIELFPQTEFAVQSLAKDSATQQLESVVAILRGKLRADVKPQPQGSTFEFETPVMVAAVLGTLPTITVNADGSVNVLNEAGDVVLSKEAGTSFTASLDTGDEAQVASDPVTGEITITCISGSFTVVGPDGTIHTLNAGDKIVIPAEGAATFIPAGGGGAPGAPAADTFGEPPGTDPTDAPVAGALDEGVSGG